MIPRMKAVLQQVPNNNTILGVQCVQHAAKKEAINDDWLHGHLTDYADTIIGIDYLENEIQTLQERG